MRRFGHTAKGTPRYFCSTCRTSSIIHRPDTRERHIEEHFILWLTGKRTKTEIADDLGLTRRALTKQFHPLFKKERPAPVPSHPRILVVDGTYIHGRTLCVLVGVDEKDRIFWKFFNHESYLTWMSFLSAYEKPDVIVADGQKGFFAAMRELWGDIPFQRCHFHVIQRVHAHLTRSPEHEVGRELLRILSDLKNVRTHLGAQVWRVRYKAWEMVNNSVLKETTTSGKFRHRRLQSARTTVRGALPYLFTYLKHPGCPNTKVPLTPPFSWHLPRRRCPGRDLWSVPYGGQQERFLNPAARTHGIST